MIVATPYAETSVTLSNLTYVIDSGYILEPAWDPRTCSNQYPTRRHSRAGCTQRKGRVGRVADGEVIRLYTRAEFNQPEIFVPHTKPAIAREPLDKFLLAAKRAGVRDLASFRWLGFDQDDATQLQERERAMRSLTKHGVIDDEGDITLKGRELEGLRATSLDWAAVMSESDAYGCSLEVATFLAFSDSSTGPFLDDERGVLAYDRFRAGCYDDLEFYLRVFHHWEKRGANKDRKAWCKSQGLDHDCLVAVDNGRKGGLKEFQKRTHTDMTKRAIDLDRLHRVRLVLARALHEWVYVRDESDVKGQLYRPLEPEACPCEVSVAIERKSACAGRTDVDGFLSVARSSFKDRVFAGFVIRLDPELVIKVRGFGPLAFARHLRQVLVEGPREIVSGAKARVTTPAAPQPDLKKYGSSGIRTFECVRGDNDHRSPSEAQGFGASRGRVATLHWAARS